MRQTKFTVLCFDKSRLKWFPLKSFLTLEAAKAYKSRLKYGSFYIKREFIQTNGNTISQAK